MEAQFVREHTQSTHGGSDGGRRRAPGRGGHIPAGQTVNSVGGITGRCNGPEKDILNFSPAQKALAGVAIQARPKPSIAIEDLSPSSSLSRLTDVRAVEICMARIFQDLSLKRKEPNELSQETLPLKLLKGAKPKGQSDTPPKGTKHHNPLAGALKRLRCRQPAKKSTKQQLFEVYVPSIEESGKPEAVVTDPS
ncbi:hypothetical protein LOK49_LG13G00145 [Camellia lanceoleosa]|uniref:Uncharacterized protein n=1 Tax=Camellia lanceoleosa TaxID=1840588 RepID=A0ACC0FKQ6_9ERIC|nr:hypothetical protein LOK49_LG13G00145 [Camellia lanceoleosa]